MREFRNCGFGSISFKTSDASTEIVIGHQPPPSVAFQFYRGTSIIMTVITHWHRCMSMCVWIEVSQIARFMGPTWGPSGSCRPQIGLMLASWTSLSRMIETAQFAAIPGRLLCLYEMWLVKWSSHYERHHELTWEFASVLCELWHNGDSTIYKTKQAFALFLYVEFDTHESTGPCYAFIICNQPIYFIIEWVIWLFMSFMLHYWNIFPGNIRVFSSYRKYYCITWYVRTLASVILTHYSEVIMGAMVSKIISLTIVYSTVYSGADHKKHQSYASLAFVRGNRWWSVNSPHTWPVTRKSFHLMTSLWYRINGPWSSTRSTYRISTTYTILCILK